MPNARHRGDRRPPCCPPTRYGYTEQIAVPQVPSFTGIYTSGAANVGITGTGSAASTNAIYQTLGYPNSGAENWDYFAFNDRDFSSVAELLLVPGCPPGLFTKQFCEVAPSQFTAANIFATVTPIITPSFTRRASVGGTGSPRPHRLPSPFTTATVPFLDVSQCRSPRLASAATSAATSTTTTLPTTCPPPAANCHRPLSCPADRAEQHAIVQPYAFPYLVDSSSTRGHRPSTTRPPGRRWTPGSTNGTRAVPVVGGPGGDGWFKMLEFFEVPSQANGSIGPVAPGVNFDQRGRTSSRA